MTSANVYYLDFLEPVAVEYDPDDRSTWVLPKVLHRERIHILCKERYDWEKILSLPMETTMVKTWGYDEEDEEWQDNELKPIKNWIKEMKIMNKELRELLSVSNNISQ